MTMVMKAKARKVKTQEARAVTASEFKARCLQLMDEVNDSGKEIVITKRGKPVSRLVPYRERPATLFGLFAGQMKILGDIIEPIDVEWEANR
ncbi:MAG TPA: type II toxin-antitoxin system Phd/YefM family antitoxin [Thermoanaerobaculia bacterium]|jgi:prevent-host-death family protein|nr:type II toxin-antitoxin system Phd/YefM family antitoxin [Thermoanaerobaculia bacterium]